jgi:hypothetical protein
VSPVPVVEHADDAVAGEIEVVAQVAAGTVDETVEGEHEGLPCATSVRHRPPLGPRHPNPAANPPARADQ